MRICTGEFLASSISSFDKDSRARGGHSHGVPPGGMQNCQVAGYHQTSMILCIIAHRSNADS